MQQSSLCLDAELGLHFPKSRWMDLERGIRAATDELGFENPAECSEWLVSTRLTKPQLETLAAHLISSFTNNRTESGKACLG